MKIKSSTWRVILGIGLIIIIARVFNSNLISRFTSPLAKMERAAVAGFKSVANDPSSVELVRSVRLDTVYSNDIKMEEIAKLQQSASEDSLAVEQHIENANMWAELGMRSDMNKEKRLYNEAKDRYIATKQRIYNIQSSMSQAGWHDVRGYKLYCLIRGRNSFGALIASIHAFSFDPQMSLVEISDPIDELPE